MLRTLSHVYVSVCTFQISQEFKFWQKKFIRDQSIVIVMLLGHLQTVKFLKQGILREKKGVYVSDLWKEGPEKRKKKRRHSTYGALFEP